MPVIGRRRHIPPWRADHVRLLNDEHRSHVQVAISGEASFDDGARDDEAGLTRDSVDGDELPQMMLFTISASTDRTLPCAGRALARHRSCRLGPTEEKEKISHSNRHFWRFE
jgi:hypothetical protein